MLKNEIDFSLQIYNYSKILLFKEFLRCFFGFEAIVSAGKTKATLQF